MAESSTIKVADMAIVHETFRAAYDESARLVRAEVEPSPERVAFLADHIDLALLMLHNHHESEDLLLWPLLLRRAPDDAASIQRVADEHKDVAVAVDRAKAACTRWRSQPAAAERDELADSLVSLNAVLRNHLDDEEGYAVPLAARTLTQDEWNAIGAHSRAGIPKDKRFVVFGMLLEPLSTQDRAYMLSEVPGPVRLLWKFVGQRQWRSYADRLRCP